MGVLFDLGVSSPQLDRAARGFSYWRDAPLDMRMDSRAGADRRDRRERVRREHARGPHPRVRRGAVRAPDRGPHRGPPPDRTRPTRPGRRGPRRIPAPAPGGRAPHPARRTFQAIRMEVNRELPNLADGLDDSVHLLAPEGRVLVLAYHSLEDRIVKERFAAWGATADAVIPGFPAEPTPRKRSCACCSRAGDASDRRRDRREPACPQRASARRREDQGVMSVKAPAHRLARSVLAPDVARRPCRRSETPSAPPVRDCRAPRSRASQRSQHVAHGAQDDESRHAQPVPRRDRTPTRPQALDPYRGSAARRSAPARHPRGAGRRGDAHDRGVPRRAGAEPGRRRSHARPASPRPRSGYENARLQNSLSSRLHRSRSVRPNSGWCRPASRRSRSRFPVTAPKRGSETSAFAD